MLSRITGQPAQPPWRPPASQLGQWIDWSQAVTLSRALDAPPADADPAADAADVTALAQECARIRAELAEAIDRGPEPAPADTGFGPFQRHLRTMRRAMLSATGQLRGALREQLASGTAQQIRLAGVDAAMEAALSPREHALLEPLSTLLEARFEALRPAADSAATTADSPVPMPAADAGTWIRQFRREMRDVLQAELGLRFHPIEGLLAALRSA